MTDYTAADLRNDIDPGTEFHVNAPMGGKGRLEVTDIDENPGLFGRWAFEARELDADDACAWRYVVCPERGGPNGGVVEAYWLDDGGEPAGGHHELYPKAFDIAQPVVHE